MLLGEIISVTSFTECGHQQTHLFRCSKIKVSARSRIIKNRLSSNALPIVAQHWSSSLLMARCMTQETFGILLCPKIFLFVQISCGALAINTFFSKRFQLSENGFDFISFIAFSQFPALIILRVIHYASTESKKKLRIIDTQDLINFLATFSFIFYVVVIISLQDISIIVGDGARNRLLQNRLWSSIPLLALFQVLRNPVSLKNSLRPIRVALGPACILNAMVISCLQLGSSQHFPRAIHQIALSLICLISSFFGGFIFRPDNNQLSQYVVPDMISVSVRKLHVYLNMVAVASAILMYILTLA